MSAAQTQATTPAGIRSHLIPATDRLSRLPYWLLAALLLGVLAFWTIATNENYRVIFARSARAYGRRSTSRWYAYTLAICWAGCLVLDARLSAAAWMQEISSFFVEILRGIPMLVLLYYISFVGAPALVADAELAGRDR